MKEKDKQWKEAYEKKSKLQLDELKGLKDRQYNELQNQYKTKLPGRLIKVFRTTEELQKLQQQQEKQQRSLLEKQRAEEESLESFLEHKENIVKILQSSTFEMPTPPVTLVLDHFAERKAKKELWNSPVFYSHRRGYKMCLQVYPNGLKEGLGTHVSVYISFVSGAFDDYLAWPFTGYITVHLINHRGKNSYNHVIKLDQETNLHVRKKPTIDVLNNTSNAWGIAKFAPHSKLEPKWLLSDKYLKDDALTFCIWKVDIFCPHH